MAKTPNGYDAVFTKTWFGSDPVPSDTGLWWCHADEPYANLSLWSDPIQIMTAEDKGWHSGPWKPSLQYNEMNYNHLFIFFDGSYNKNDGSPFPYNFTMGCLEIERPIKYIPLTE